MFKDELKSLLNQHSCENESDTPDFILADFLDGCLDVFNKAVSARQNWWGHTTWTKSNEPADVVEAELRKHADSFSDEVGRENPGAYPDLYRQAADVINRLSRELKELKELQG